MKVNELINEMSILIDKSNIDDLNPKTATDLLRIGHKLSIYKVSLGAELANIETKTEQLKHAYELKEIDRYLHYRNEESLSQNDSGEKAKQDVANDKSEYLTHRGYFLKMKAFHKDVTEVVMDIRARVNYMKWEQSESTIEAK